MGVGGGQNAYAQNVDFFFYPFLISYRPGVDGAVQHSTNTFIADSLINSLFK
jgi:hypothetical protein